MRLARTDNQLTLTLNLVESRLLHRVFTVISENYRIKPGELDPKAAAAWYSTRGCETAKLSAAETRDWQENLHGFRSARLRLLEDWAGQLAARQAGPYELRCTVENAHQLVGALNDHRLLVAARNDIGQAEMDLHSLGMFNRLVPARQVALFEVHFLAQMMEELLRVIAPDAAGWME